MIHPYGFFRFFYIRVELEFRALFCVGKSAICHFAKLSHHPQLDAHTNEYNESLHLTKSKAID